MNGWLLLVSSNKTSHYFKEWATAGDVLRKNLLPLQKFGAPDREGETSMKNSRVSVISFSNYRVVKNELDRVSFQILYPDDLFKQIF